MKKTLNITLIFILFIALTSSSFHKFYVSIYQINYVPKKKMLEITSRIFIDDLNTALEKKFNKQTFIGTDKETPEDVVLMKKYLSEKFKIKVNGVSKPINYLSKEVETTILVCYFNSKEISKIDNLSIENNALLEINDEQQNVIQANIKGEKQSLLLTSENYKGMLK
ncbi:DUF6702 family protein [Flavobacterium sp.]|uniref:DUF6702 family protein n=1 Tax=Flavobacterium sp. TaxID=239 RepID=UPI00374FF588